MNTQKLKLQLKRLLWRVSPRAFKKLVPFHGQVFSLGVFSGNDPFNLSTPTDIVNPVFTADQVTDEPAAFVADPFMFQEKNRWFMFFEIMSCIDRLGKIGLASSTEGRHWNYEGKVLEEKFHLAYPHVFRWSDRFFMIPDSIGHGVRLYEATKFPSAWKFQTTLIDDPHLVDSSIFEFDNLWWMFTASSPTPKDPKTLHLFFAESPIGNWHEHPSSPLVQQNDQIARPGGRVLVIDGKPVRFAQNGIPYYGSCVRAFKILELTIKTYREIEIQPEPILRGGAAFWNSDGMHHIDAHKMENGSWFACVDGWHFSQQESKLS